MGMFVESTHSVQVQCVCVSDLAFLMISSPAGTVCVYVDLESVSQI